MLVDESFEDYVTKSNQEIRLQRYNIAGESWLAILKELQLIGITAGNLFDSLDGIADDIKIKEIIQNYENS